MRAGSFPWLLLSGPFTHAWWFFSIVSTALARGEFTALACSCAMVVILRLRRCLRMGPVVLQGSFHFVGTARFQRLIRG